MQVVLIMRQGGRNSRVIPLKKPQTVLGRQEGCGVRILSQEISRQHCRIRAQGQQITVRDLGSVNGTFVNGQLIQGEQALRQGDELRIGPVTFVIQFREKPAAAPATPPPVAKPAATPRSLKPPEFLPKAEMVDDEQAAAAAAEVEFQEFVPAGDQEAIPMAAVEEDDLPVAEVEEDAIPMAQVEEEDIPVAEVEEEQVPMAAVEEDLPVAELEAFEFTPAAEVEEEIITAELVEDEDDIPWAELDEDNS